MQPLTLSEDMPPPVFVQHFANTTFLVLGDSLVADYDWQKRMPQFTIHNLGFAGAKIRDILKALPRLKAEFTSAGIIMIMVGSNDLAAGNYRFTDQLRKVITTISHDFPTAELLVNSLLPIKLPSLGQSAIPLLNDTITTLCRTTGCCYVDVFSRFQFSGDDLIADDGVHLNAAGYELWARTVLEHIAFLVEDD